MLYIYKLFFKLTDFLAHTYLKLGIENQINLFNSARQPSLLSSSVVKGSLLSTCMSYSGPMAQVHAVWYHVGTYQHQSLIQSLALKSHTTFCWAPKVNRKQ